MVNANMIFATKIRLYPDQKQQDLLSKQFGCSRFVYNQALALKKSAWEEKGETLSCYQIKKLLPAWKKEKEWLKEADSQVLQQSILNLDVAYKNFFSKRARYPKFKNKKSNQSIQYPQRVKIDGNCLYLPKVGKVKAIIHRSIEGKIKTVTVSLSSTGKYYASILTENEKITPEPIKHIDHVIGLDLGLTSFIVSSDEKKWDNPRFLKHHLSNLKKKQKKLSRKITGSSNRRKARLLVAKAHEKITFCRNDFQHQLAFKLACENQAVGMESLDIKKMQKNKRLSQSIGDAGWSSFVNKLKYKLQRQGKHLVQIDQFFPSSKQCPSCGHIKQNMTLDIRLWTCTCGQVWDRDIAAAKNILQQSILKLKADGHTVSACGGLRKTGLLPAVA